MKEKKVRNWGAEIYDGKQFKLFRQRTKDEPK